MGPITSLVGPPHQWYLAQTMAMTFMGRSPIINPFGQGTMAAEAPLVLGPQRWGTGFKVRLCNL